MDDLLATILDKIEYDFCEDDEDVQGTWQVDVVEDVVTVRYSPFDDSPYAEATATYRITRLT